jgi:hypothetical protein
MTLPIAFFAQPCFRAASPHLAKLKGATELTLETPGVGLALAMDYYRMRFSRPRLTATSRVARLPMKMFGIFRSAGRN